MYLMPLDELNSFKEKQSIHYEEGRIRSKEDKDLIADDLFELFLLAYALGCQSANTDLGTSIKPSQSRVEDAVNAKVAGKTWRERVDEYYESGGTEYDIQRIAETDMERIYNTAILDVADIDGSPRTMKTWQTMMDDKVRDTHFYLEGVSVPYDADFYTYDGDHARAPGLFALPENNINCRCSISLSRI